VLLRLQSKRVHVDTHGRDVGVVLEGLDQVEVVALAYRETVVAVQLDQRRHRGVVARHALDTGHGVTRLQDGAVPPVRVVEGLLSLPGVDNRVIARHKRVALDHPDELLARVVEVQLDLVGRGGDGLATRELQALDQVLVSHLGELAALVRVEVDVVDIQRGGDQASVGHAVANDVGVRGVLGGKVPAHVVQRVELEVDADLVVLEGNQWQSKARVAVEPELERNVQRVLGRAAHNLVRRARGARTAVIVALLTTLYEGVHQLGHVTNHLGIASLLARLLGELIPNLEPVTILLVDALATNLQLHRVNQIVTRPVEPAELGTRAVRSLEVHRGQGGLEVHAVDQVTIALNGAGHALAKVGGTIERVLNGLHGEVGVATIHHLEEGNLGITGQVNILGTIGYELH